jgi:hypothetical protein
MTYTNNLKALEGRVVTSAVNHPGVRFVMCFSGEVDLDIRVDDNGELSIGVREPEPVIV